MSDDLNHLYPLHELQLLCDDFKIGKLISIQKRLGGHFNINLKVKTTKGEYVIRRMSPSASVPQILHVQQILLKLRKKGIPVILPMTARTGMVYSKWNENLVQVSPFINAEPFSNSIKQVHMSGVMLRKFHDALENEKSVPLPNWSIYPPEQFLSKYLQKLESNTHLSDKLKIHFTRIFNWVMTFCEAHNKQGELQKTIIHGDWHFWNLQYTRNSKVKLVSDFDFLQRAERIYDLAYTLWVIYHLLPKSSRTPFAKAHLMGYGELTKIEEHHLPLLLAKISLFFVCTMEDPNEEVLMNKLDEQEEFIKWVLLKEGLKTI